MNPIKKLDNTLRNMIIRALESAREQDLLQFSAIPEFAIEVPREKQHGDFASNVAMLMAREARMAPRKIAESLVGMINTSGTPVERIEIAGAGFINFYLNNSWLYEIPRLVYNMKDKYGYNEKINRKVQVEFVSANPTGNLHMGNARGGAIGDTLANILERAGNDVEREFYINDAGNQIEIFTDSMEARYFQLTGHDVEFPENGYAGLDLIDTVRNLIADYGETLLDMPRDERRKIIVEYALQEKVDYIKETLLSFGIVYDVWFNEKSLHEAGKIDQVIQVLKDRDYCYENEGALWFKSTAFGDEKDEVLMRANGLPT
ncbi:MAG: arginine--tRNA ligase, partial [Bacteroidales bacterium]|nr:arginine--tRNA ligase [Bacteroidales bacterium]